MPRLAIIADDLTGAGDTGVQFGKFGLKTRVLLDLAGNDDVGDMDILVLDTDSRAAAPSVAAERVKAACRNLVSLGIDGLYKKVDSTLRGNLGVEIRAAWEEFRPELTVIAPAYPKAKRGTVDGYQLVAGMPVSLTEFAHDPKTPVTQAWIPELLEEGAGRKVGSVSLHQVMKGTDAIRLKLRQQLGRGTDWIVCDAVTDDNLRHIAEAASCFKRVLWVGSAGLAEQLPSVNGWIGTGMPLQPPLACEAVLVVAGSVSAVTEQQIAHYVTHTDARLVTVDPVQALLAPRSESLRIIAMAAPYWRRQNVVIACSNDKTALESAKQAGQQAGLDANAVGTRIAGIISEAVAELVNQGVGGLFLTGGETAVSCCRGIGAAGIDIIEEVSPGITAGCLSGGRFTGLPVVTKAGAFGDRQAITRAAAFLKGRNIHDC